MLDYQITCISKQNTLHHYWKHYVWPCPTYHHNLCLPIHNMLMPLSLFTYHDWVLKRVDWRWRLRTSPHLMGDKTQTWGFFISTGYYGQIINHNRQSLYYYTAILLCICTSSWEPTQLMVHYIMLLQNLPQSRMAMWCGLFPSNGMMEEMPVTM